MPAGQRTEQVDEGRRDQKQAEQGHDALHDADEVQGRDFLIFGKIDIN
jgi:hypothetical protein